MPDSETRKLQDIREALHKAINICWDVTMPGRFPSNVDPVRWVQELQTLLVDTLEQNK
ncbi:hypothetical protein [Terracidiphilus gabretensis]|jgi:hypothetical protein|uniref:hypothetical protein n=1 Tax=Terracidiphilus gabretensis TaxID=1577687 RepID=UPI0012F96707|nr:hypothetical protein [Terracidiphilus gabretensis]